MKVISNGKKHLMLRLDNNNLVVCNYRDVPDKYIPRSTWTLAEYNGNHMVGESLDFKSKIALKNHLKAVYNCF